MRLRRYVTPFYLKLMGCAAGDADTHLITKVRKRASHLSSSQVAQLLQMHWRPRVMGAWYAVAVQDPSLSTPVHDSLETSLGHLTSPPLITATLAYPSQRTATLLHDYIETDREHQWGAAGFAAAALDRLVPAAEGQVDAPPRFSPEDVELLDKLLAFGRALQSK